MNHHHVPSPWQVAAATGHERQSLARKWLAPSHSVAARPLLRQHRALCRRLEGSGFGGAGGKRGHTPFSLLGSFLWLPRTCILQGRQKRALLCSVLARAEFQALLHANHDSTNLSCFLKMLLPFTQPRAAGEKRGLLQTACLITSVAFLPLLFPHPSPLVSHQWLLPSALHLPI